jgi:hypothetical protein
LVDKELVEVLAIYKKSLYNFIGAGNCREIEVECVLYTTALVPKRLKTI